MDATKWGRHPHPVMTYVRQLREGDVIADVWPYQSTEWRWEVYRDAPGHFERGPRGTATTEATAKAAARAALAEWVRR